MGVWGVGVWGVGVWGDSSDVRYSTFRKIVPVLLPLHVLKTV